MPFPLHKYVVVNGVNIQVFSIRYIAQMLKRCQHTIRRWERAGHVPRPIFNVDDKCRWYTKEETEAWLRIFQEEFRMGFAIERTQLSLRLRAEVAQIEKNYKELLRK